MNSSRSRYGFSFLPDGELKVFWERIWEKDSWMLGRELGDYDLMLVLLWLLQESRKMNFLDCGFPGSILKKYDGKEGKRAARKLAKELKDGLPPLPRLECGLYNQILVRCFETIVWEKVVLLYFKYRDDVGTESPNNDGGL